MAVVAQSSGCSIKVAGQDVAQIGSPINIQSCVSAADITKLVSCSLVLIGGHVAEFDDMSIACVVPNHLFVDHLADFER